MLILTAAVASAVLLSSAVPTSAQVFVSSGDITNKTFDYVIAGAGTAGCVVASRLAAKDFSVLLVERGPATFSDSVAKQRQAPIFTLYNWNTDELSDPITAFPSSRRAPLTSVPMVRGNALGGTTNVNAGAWSRPLYTDFDKWATTGWNASDIRQYFLRIEKSRYGATDPQNHGTSGPLTISFPSHNQTLNDQFLAAVKELGKPVLTDGGNGLNNVGVWPLVTVNNGGKRLTSCDAYFKLLADTKNNGKAVSNLVITTKAQVAKINFDATGTVAVGARIEYGSGVTGINVNVGKEFIVSSGVYGSPHLLLLSGVGPAADLKKLNIPVVKDLPVGKNLIARPISIVTNFGKVQTPEMDVAAYLNSNTYETFLATGQGILGTPVLGVWGNLAFDNKTKAGESDVIVGMTTVNYPGASPIPRTIVHMCLLSDPKSRGTIALTSSKWSDKPKILPNMFDVDSDLDILVSCSKWLRAFQKTKAMADYESLEFLPTELVQSDSSWRTYIANNPEGFSMHAWGSVPIGNSGSSTAVVDGKLKVFGIKNLRVADTSIIPTGFSSGIMSIAYVIGEKASDLILADA
ncbi:hypothetical protein BJ742DRAFT_776240 [Cladochytrium replicatum]|nr:hypothetical protein BJ742DRAFT_776240 [Cladochytrium replicatum]